MLWWHLFVAFSTQMLAEVIWEPPELPAVLPQIIGHKGKREKWYKNPKPTVCQYKFPGGAPENPHHHCQVQRVTSTHPALQRDGDTDTGIQGWVAACFSLHMPLLLISSQTSSPSSSWPYRMLSGSLALDFTSFPTNRDLHPIPVADLHPTSPSALSPQRCHDPRPGCGFNDMQLWEHLSSLRTAQSQVLILFKSLMALACICSFFPALARAGNVTAGSNLTRLTSVLVQS